MARWARAGATLIVAVSLFFVSYWVFHLLSWSWLPKLESDRVVLAAGFATLVGSSAFLLLGRWVDGNQTDADSPNINGSPVQESPTGSGDQIAVTGPFHAPTVIKGVQINEGQDEKGGRR